MTRGQVLHEAIPIATASDDPILVMAPDLQLQHLLHLREHRLYEIQLKGTSETRMF